MLTPKMSIRRKNVISHYQTLISGMYSGSEGISIKHGHSSTTASK